MNNSTFTVTPALTHFAGRAGDHNNRAMAGSPAIAEELARRLGVDPVVISQPEQALATGWQVELDAARSALCAMGARYEQLFNQGAVPFTALSRCAVSLATLPVVARHRPDAVVVWLDAHADINTPDSTTSGYLGGLALAGPLGKWDSGFGQGLSASNTILVGARDIDPFEQQLIARGAVTLIPPGPDIAGRVSAAVAGRPVYLHLDCDVLEPGLVPTDYSVTGGLSLTELRQIAEAVAISEVVGLEIAEFEADTTPEGTQAAARRLLDALQPLLPIMSSA
ncbi:arginase family protein [Pollutimonas nitritireducens]|nr:arginase family protein [Pollutimonas nitritireducens]